MNTFGSILKGHKFKFKGRLYTKIDDRTAISLRNTKQIVKFFTESQLVNLDIGT